MSKIKSFERSYKYSLSSSLSCHRLAHFIRQLIADSLRSSRAFQVDALIGGWNDSNNKSILYSIDRIGSLKEVSYSCHGQFIPFLYSILDRYTHSSTLTESDCDQRNGHISVEKGYKAIISCWQEFHKRSIVGINECHTLGVYKRGVICVDKKVRIKATNI